VVKIFGSVPFVAVLSLALLVLGAAVAAETAGTPNEAMGALVLGLATGGGGCATGTAIRMHRKHRRR
jgi:hypothetical protein